MSRTYRKDRKTKKNVRDGTRQYVSVSCEHHGGCPWCENNRLFDQKKVEQVTEFELAIYKNEYYDIQTTEDCLTIETPSGVKAT
jgi:hypothetical protein